MSKFSYKLGDQKQTQPNFTSPNSFRSRFLSFKKSCSVFGLVALTLLLAVSANAAFSSDGRSFFGIFDYSGATITTTNTSGNVTTKSSKPYDFLNLLNWKTKSAPPPVAFFNVSVDFRQSANNDGLGLGSNHWLNSIVQSSNSVYYEGMSNFQRAIFTDVPATTGNNHSLTFEHDATKGGIHAYDFLTSYQQAIVNNQALLGVPVTLNPCGTNIAASMVTPCNTVRGGLNFIDVDVPDDTFLSKDGPTATKIAAYEVINGNRTIRIWGNAPFVPGSAVLTLSHSVATQADSADSNINYTLTWQSTSTVILLEMAGHISVTGDGTGVSWGTGLGSSNISGGPYHFKLGDLGGAVTGGVQSEVTSLGAQDNQIKGADVKIVCPTCSVSGPATVCASTTSTFSESIVGTCASQSILWSVTGNGSITGSNNSTNVAVISGSGAGSYTVTATLTCASCPPVVCNKTVAVTAPITITETHTDVSCFSGSTGAIDLTVSGGTAPYSYSWSNGATGQDLTSLAAGTYTVIVTDSNPNSSCTATKAVTIAQPAALSATEAHTNVSCNGGNNGAIDLTVTGGTAPYTYTWSPGGVLPQDRTGLTAGIYSVTVTDANNCSIQISVTITEPTVVVATSSATPILCNGGDSTVTVGASGGTGAYTGTGTFTVKAGTHAYTVTDANGCATTTSVTVTEPTAVVATSSATAIACFGGTSTVTVGASGGTGAYTGTGTFTRTAGTYSFTVTDANGCPATTSVTITEPTAVMATSSATPIACFGGTSTVTVGASGGTGAYTGTGTFTVTAGTYTYNVTDANGCPASTTVTIGQPSLLVASSSATAITCAVPTSTVTVSASGGTGPYTGTGTFTVGAGAYSYTVTDANGCKATTTGTIIEPVCLAFCSYTQGGWGATPQGNNPARLLSNNFGVAFPSGIEVGIPGVGGFSMKFTTALGVQNYLPAGGTPNALTGDPSADNPQSSSAGVFGGQVLALRINVGMSDAGKTTAGYGDLKYIGAGCLSGKTVRQILAASENALGGGAPPVCPISELNGLATRLNEAFDNCRTTDWALANLSR